MKNKDKVCMICHTVIDNNKEFCEFIHFEKKEKIKSEGYYHVNCFRDRLKGTQEQQAVTHKAMEILDKIGAKV